MMKLATVLIYRMDQKTEPFLIDDNFAGHDALNRASDQMPKD